MDATELAFEKIIKLIMEHEYKPGERIMETSLTERFKLSRTPIREALNRLASSGFLEKNKGQRGYRIPSLTPPDMKYVFETRALLEGNAAGAAAVNHTGSELKVLKDLNEKEADAFIRNDKKVYSQCNQKFHFNIAQMSKNPYIYRFVEQLFWRSSLYNFFFAGFYTYDKDLKLPRPVVKRINHIEHWKIIDAIQQGDGELARTLAHEHIMIAYRHLLNLAP